MTIFHIPPKINSRLREKERLKPFASSLSPPDALPTFANGLHEKHTLRRYRNLTSTFYIPVPWPFSRCIRVRHIKIILPIPAKASKYMGRTRWKGLNHVVALISIILLFWNLYNFMRSWPSLPFKPKKTTLVFSQEDVRRIWEWEVASGHYQSRRSFVPGGITLETSLSNPGIPQESTVTIPHAHTPRKQTHSIVGSGLKRTYIDMQSLPPNVGYPPRPIPGSIADLDIIMDQCDFGNNKYVRDCLEMLRVGAGLDNGRRVRRGDIDDYKYIYMEEGQRLTIPTPPRTPPTIPPGITPGPSTSIDESLEPPPHLPPPRSYWTSSELATACDPDHPRIIHIFWGGPFTAHPHTAILSFLFTQNLGLHLPPNETVSICRPQIWVWMQTGPAREANPKPNALKEMYESLSSNPWSAPFLHPRFKDIIRFKLWNTTEQLDNIRELKDEWRSINLFNSGGHVYEIPVDIDNPKNQTTKPWKKPKREDEELMNRIGSTSSNSYDRMRTILSDLARFVLCHRYGGIYLDTDTVFLRDWEELWGWKGAFAYRWSRLPQYNTAVLKLNKGSALGTFLIRTALRHGLDFHPMTAITAYAEDAGLDNLLLRLPDALFDSPWLNTEGFQRDRPPSPPLTEFAHFFETPVALSGDAQSLGFEGFFRGAYSYHWHNNWWKPWDSTRNWPDLGPRFAEAERLGRLQAAEAARSSQQAESSSSKTKTKVKRSATNVEDEGDKQHETDKRDLDWATILKRTFDSYIRGERPNMYGEWIHW